MTKRITISDPDGDVLLLDLEWTDGVLSAVLRLPSGV